MQDLLVLLADNQFHSGEELGKELGITRAAVWKKMKKLEELGIDLYSVKGRGYRLPKALELLSLNRMHELGLSTPTTLHFKTGSTNADVKRLINKGEKLPALVVAELQTDGKGRRGRQWQGGGVGKNILLSLGWRFEQGATTIEGLSLATGVAVSRVLAKFGVTGIGLKWPNDVLVGGKKICGILLEMVADQDASEVIIGIGLNVSITNKEMAEIDQPITDIEREINALPSRNRLLVELVNEIEKVCVNFSSGNGLTAYLTEWMQQDVLRSQHVRLLQGGREEYGIAKGIDKTGALLFEKDGAVRAVHGGEISVRKR